MVYAQAGQMQAACGIGNFRLGIEYAGDDTFDRDITISLIPDPLAVVWDPLSVEPTGKDARYCFVIDEMPRKDFEAKYPDSQPSALSDDAVRQGWFEKDTVRITEYWVVKETPTKIYQLDDGSIVKGRSPRVLRPLPSVRRCASACMYLINGMEILDGPYEIPIQRVPVFRCEGWTLTVGARSIAGAWCGLPKTRRGSRTTGAQRLPRFSLWLRRRSGRRWRARSRAARTCFRNAHRSGDPLLIFNDAPRTSPARRSARVPRCTCSGSTDLHAGHQGRYRPSRCLAGHSVQRDLGQGHSRP
jgi:hypothetical protein